MQPFLAGAIRSGGFKMNLKSMSIDKLTKLRDQVDAALHGKVADERRTLQAELGKLSRFSTSQLRSKGLRLGVRGPVAPKYRNPEVENRESLDRKSTRLNSSHT